MPHWVLQLRAKQPASQPEEPQDCFSFGKYNAVFAHTLSQLMLIYRSACQPY